MNPSSQPTLASIDSLFEKPKLMCFGRYAVELPRETEQVMGFGNIDGGFKLFTASGPRGAEEVLDRRWKQALLTDRRSLRLSENKSGPVKGASYFWFYDGSLSQEEDLRMLDGALAVGPKVYLYKAMASPRDGLTPKLIFSNMTALMRGMRAWNGIEVPREPGVCIDGAFIHEPTQRFQEIMSSGFYFPSLPDVSFSVMSNKNASVDGDNGHGLLRRVDEARREQMFYPYTFLRRGKRTLHGLWDGEEVLARRSDGALIFDWELVGEPGNPARPSWFEMGFRTRVANNQVGAAETTSISDEQAVALWDRLLDNVKFRVMVPGATPQAVARL